VAWLKTDTALFLTQLINMPFLMAYTTFDPRTSREMVALFFAIFAKVVWTVFSTVMVNSTTRTANKVILIDYHDDLSQRYYERNILRSVNPKRPHVKKTR
jgi:hypothetical protein